MTHFILDSSETRGICLIINNLDFEITIDDETDKIRLGAEKDVARLKKLFSKLEFDVQTKQNIERKKLSNVLDKLICDIKERKINDALVLVIMSHGGLGQEKRNKDKEVIYDINNDEINVIYIYIYILNIP